MSELVNRSEIARRLCIPPTTVYSWHERGHLPVPAQSTDKSILFDWEKVEPIARKLMETNKKETP